MKLHKDRKAMELLITNISNRANIRADVLEKDYYVTLLLNELTKRENKIMLILKGSIDKFVV